MFSSTPPAFSFASETRPGMMTALLNRLGRGTRDVRYASRSLSMSPPGPKAATGSSQNAGFNMWGLWTLRNSSCLQCAANMKIWKNLRLSSSTAALQCSTDRMRKKLFASRTLWNGTQRSFATSWATCSS